MMIKRIGIFAGLLFLIVHFTISILYTAPTGITSPELQNKLHAYMNPLFTQGWKLFVPAPDDLQLHYRYKTNGNWTDWKLPLDSELPKHRYRITYHSRLSIAIYNLSWYLSHYPNEEKWRKEGYTFLKNYTTHYYSEQAKEIEAFITINKKDTLWVQLNEN